MSRCLRVHGYADVCRRLDGHRGPHRPRPTLLEWLVLLVAREPARTP